MTLSRGVVTFIFFRAALLALAHDDSSRKRTVEQLENPSERIRTIISYVYG